jgi:hypothetical protein
MTAAATAPATAKKLTEEAYTAELAGAPAAGAPAGATETVGWLAKGEVGGVSALPTS